MLSSELSSVPTAGISNDSIIRLLLKYDGYVGLFEDEEADEDCECCAACRKVHAAVVCW